ILFEPQPLEYFKPDAAPARLMRLREKLSALVELPVDRVLCLRFDADLASMEPDTFVERVLCGGLGVGYVVVGADFRYGHQRRGDIETLARAGRKFGFETATAVTVELDGERVSSSRVRAALGGGDLRLV